MAALNIYSTDEGAFDHDVVDLAKTFSAYAGVALANMHLYAAQARVAEQLQAAMASRAVIEQAKGMVMGERRCDADTAFDVLVKLSQDSNHKLRDVAQALVDEASADTVGEHGTDGAGDRRQQRPRPGRAWRTGRPDPGRVPAGAARRVLTG
jgi:hypothetical protein